jgi:glycosyl-4,4'-diaponeurosporenoate acyltransferase
VRIFFLSKGWELVLCFAIWIVISLSASYICLYLPDKVFNSRAFFFRPHPFEKEGQIYEKVFKVKRWKHLLPDGGGLWKKRGYKKRNLADLSEENLERFLLETCRAELTHWLAILPFWVFGLFLPASFLWFMLLYALLANLPCIIAQRYNRPRFLRLLEKTRSRNRPHIGDAPVS